MKLIFVTWGVISWAGKWVTSASIWKLLKSSGFKVNMIKIDPYLQVDAGTMSPFEHGEVFVTEDWAETDLDIGNYERYIDENLSWKNNLTTGKIYRSVISKERRWDFLGKTVQVVPHITNEIKSRIIQEAWDYDITIVEVWGTVGDMESLPFFESIRQLKSDIGKENVLYIHLGMLLYIRHSNEFKTKPIQHSVRNLREVWIQPDLLVCRSEFPISKEIKEKISLLADVEYESIIEAIDVEATYQIPVVFEKQNIHNIISKKLNLKIKQPKLKKWKEVLGKMLNPDKEVNVGIVGKYADFQDSYMSLIEALKHAWAENNTKINIKYLVSDELEGQAGEEKIKNLKQNENLHGLIVPGWFWLRGVEWKISVVKYARENNLPFLWLCLWLQTAVVEYARNVCWLKNAHSTEFFEDTVYPVIDLMLSQKYIKNKWWTMRLGKYQAVLKEKTLVHKLYGNKNISERHRHRYEVNPDYHNVLSENWLILSGLSPDWKLVEFVELQDHPFFVATQAHPEFKSRFDSVHPLFDWFIKACLKNK